MFFCSYFVMEQYLKRWSVERIIPKMNKVKQIFVEQRKRLEHNQETEDFIRAHKEGAVMMSVIGGKFSGKFNLIYTQFIIFKNKSKEGFDFLNGLARGIICLGIPYPNFSDPELKAKFNYIKFHCDGKTKKTFVKMNGIPIELSQL